MSDLFISYSRQDQPFVRRLHDALTALGHTVFVDWTSIPASAEWMEEIQGAIARSDAVLFVLSPDFAASQTCRTELALAEEDEKRLIPIVHRDVTPPQIPEALAKLNWIFMRDGDDFAVALQAVDTAIATDLDYVHTAARLLVRAQEWEGKEKNASLLLRGSELREAESWLAGSGGREPVPTQLHTRYIVASRQSSSQRQRGIIGVLSVVVALMVILTSTTLVFYRQANQERDTANIRALAAQAMTTTFGVNLDQRLLLSLLAVHESGSDLRFEAHNSLLTLLQSNSDVVQYLHTPDARVGDGSIKVAESDDGNTLVSYSGAGLFVWDLQQKPFTPRPIPLPRRYNNPDSTLLAISADGKYAAVAGDNSTSTDTSASEMTIVSLATGQTVATYRGFVPSAIALSADGKRVAADYLSDTPPYADVIAIWSLGGDPQHPSAHITANHRVSRLAFNNTGTLLAIGGSYTASVWNLTTGRASDIAAIDLDDPSSDTYPEDGLAFSADGTWLVVSGDSANGGYGETDIFTVANGGVTLAGRLPEKGEITVPHNDTFYLASCTDILICTQITVKTIDLGTSSVSDTRTIDGVGVFAHVAGWNRLAVSTDNGSILLWGGRVPGNSSIQLPGSVFPESFSSPNGQVVAHFHDDGTLGLWNGRTGKELPDTPQTRGIVFGDSTLNTIGVSNDGAVVVALEKNGRILAHRRTGVTPLADPPSVLAQAGGTDRFVQLAMDWTGQRVAGLTCIGPEGSSCATTEVDVWDAASGERIARRTFANGASIAFTPDGRTLAVGQLNVVTFYDFAQNTATTPIDVSEVGIVDALAFDQSGKTMAALGDYARGISTPYSSSNGNYLLLWDVPTGKQLGLPQGAELGLKSLSFDAQGDLYGLAGPFIYRHDTSLDALTRAACAIANRNLTRDEWRQYAGDQPYVKLCAGLP